jgi:hypothetical protein
MKVLELFCGTKSVGRGFQRAGYEVVSLDADRKCSPDICCSILDWDYRAAYEPGTFHAVWASPPCTMYSIARSHAKIPRDLEGADALVRRTLEIIDYFKPRWWTIENPATGLLKKRDVVAGLPFKDVTYCSYGRPLRKWTRVWTNMAHWNPRSLCDGVTCPSVLQGEGRHLVSAQRGPAMTADGGRRAGDRLTLEQLHALPPQLVDEIVAACSE